jgi:hypothetical protein
MAECPHHQMPVRRAAAIPGLVHDPGHVLARINPLTAALAALDLALDALHAGAKLRLVVERGHYHMPPLPPAGVITVMADDEAPDAVILGVNLRHRPRVSPPPSGITINGTPAPKTGTAADL